MWFNNIRNCIWGVCMDIAEIIRKNTEENTEFLLGRLSAERDRYIAELKSENERLLQELELGRLLGAVLLPKK